MANVGKPKQSQKAVYRSRITFATGLLAGSALATLVPWEALEQTAPGTRLGCLATLGGGFVLFRLIFAGSGARKATSIGMVSLGGLMMSAGARVMPGEWVVSPVGIGAASFLFGITLLMRERYVPADVREQVVERLLEDTVVEAQDTPHTDASAMGTNSIERVRSLKLLADTAPLTEKEPA